MSGIGPELPPHLLAKRKRREENAATSAAPATSGANRPPSPDSSKRRKVVAGPAMPPAPLDERPPIAPKPTTEDSDDSDDGYGPALPSANGGNSETHQDAANSTNDLNNTTQRETKPQRDDWMTMPPKQDDLAARLDPSKQRARGFNTGKSARGANAHGEDNSTWNETPEQKRIRLQNEMMGVASEPDLQQSKRAGQLRGKEGSVDSATRKQIEKARGPSLMEQHSKGKGVEAEDDPSKRAFDREKDMSTGMRIGHAQKKELLNQASGFSSKFSGGSFL